LGYPVKGLAEITPGWYWVQALLHRYETFHLMDRGEGQAWKRAPGNFYNKPQKMWSWRE